MQKQAPTLGRLAAMVAFALSCFGLLLFLWLSFGGPVPLKPKGYRVDVPFQEANLLAEQADVRVAGIPIGKVVDLRRSPSGNATLASLELDPRYAPLPADARAVLRRKTLIGETYVELTLGDRDGETVPDGGVLAPRQVQETVELDEILDAFDPMTRMAYQTWQRSLSEAIGGGRGRDLNDAFGNLPGFVEAGGDLFEVLEAQRGAVQRLVKNTGAVFGALTQRERQLRRLVENQDTVFTAIQREKEAFAQTFAILPTFLRESRLTYQRLDGFARRAEPVFSDLEPAMADLAVTLDAVGDLSPDLERFFKAYDPLIDASRESLPASREIFDALSPFLDQLGPWLGELNPLLAWIGEHSHTTSDIMSNLGAATAATTTSRDPQGTGHYLRQFGPSGLETAAVHPTRLSSNRGNAYINPLGLLEDDRGQFIESSFDCENSGGEKPITDSPPPGSPACIVAPAYTFQGKTSKYPHVESETELYRRGGRLSASPPRP